MTLLLSKEVDGKNSHCKFMAYARARSTTKRPMFGTFQQSSLRIEVTASGQTLRQILTQPAKLQQWMAPIRLSPGLPEQLREGLTFTSWTGPIAVQHSVELLESNRLRLLLSQGIDGFHEWHWGEGWVQSRLEGISLLPLNLGQTLSLLQLKQFLAHL
jgi:hypothetical protein